MPFQQQQKEDEPLVESMYPVRTRMPRGVTVGDSALCYCVPCLLSAINSLFAVDFAISKIFLSPSLAVTWKNILINRKK